METLEEAEFASLIIGLTILSKKMINLDAKIDRLIDFMAAAGRNFYEVPPGIEGDLMVWTQRPGHERRAAWLAYAKGNG